MYRSKFTNAIAIILEDGWMKRYTNNDHSQEADSSATKVIFKAFVHRSIIR